MARIKKGTAAHKRRKHVLQDAKGFRWGRKAKYRLAKDALRHAGAYAFRDRKAKKRSFRAQWQVSINAAARSESMSYGAFMARLKTREIALDRKILSKIAIDHPDVFKKIVESVA